MHLQFHFDPITTDIPRATVIEYLADAGIIELDDAVTDEQLVALLNENTDVRAELAEDWADSIYAESSSVSIVAGETE